MEISLTVARVPGVGGEILGGTILRKAYRRRNRNIRAGRVCAGLASLSASVPCHRSYGVTSIVAIIPLSSWERMWQWKTNRPTISGFVNGIITFTSPLIGTSTMSRWSSAG